MEEKITVADLIRVLEFIRTKPAELDQNLADLVSVLRAMDPTQVLSLGPSDSMPWPLGSICQSLTRVDPV